MTIKPLAKFVLIKDIEAESKTSGGIIVPDGTKEKPQKGEIIDVGPEVNSVKIGQIVYYIKWSGNEIKEDLEDYKIIKEEDILATYA